MGTFETVITIIMLPFAGLVTFVTLSLLVAIILIPTSLIVWFLKKLFGSKETLEETMTRFQSFEENVNLKKCFMYISIIAIFAFAYVAFFTDAGNLLIRP